MLGKASLLTEGWAGGLGAWKLPGLQGTAGQGSLSPCPRCHRRGAWGTHQSFVTTQTATTDSNPLPQWVRLPSATAASFGTWLAHSRNSPTKAMKEGPEAGAGENSPEREEPAPPLSLVKPAELSTSYN